MKDALENVDYPLFVYKIGKVPHKVTSEKRAHHARIDRDEDLSDMRVDD